MPSLRSKLLSIIEKLGSYISNNKERDRTPSQQDMQHISPRFDSFSDGTPWPPEPPHWHHDLDYLIPIIIVSIFYTFGFLNACCILMEVPAGTREVGLREKPWIPTWARGDACLRPIFFVLPALLWPLVFPYMILTVLYYFLKCVVHIVWNIVSPAASTTCCGIPLPRRWSRGTDQNATTPSPPSPDLEMGPVVAYAGDGEGGESGSGVDSDPADVRSSASGESERPPSYTSQPPNEDEDDSRETDGLLTKAKDDVEMDEK